MFGGNFSALDYDELKKTLPPYFFMSPKKKVKYFQKISVEYMNKLKKSSSDSKKTQRLNFQLEKNKTKGNRT